MTAATTRLILVACVLVLGVALKVSRYADRDGTTSSAANIHVTRIMAASGWLEMPPSPGTAEPPYTQRAFARQGCDNPIYVAILDGNAESAAFFRVQHQGNAAFVQETVVEHPSGLDRQLSTLTTALGKMFGASTEISLPVLAIAPPPQTAPSPCAGPPAAAWQHERSATPKA